MSVVLFLYYYDGIIIVFMNFQFDILCFVYCILYVLISYVICNSVCCSSQRMFGFVINSIFQEIIKNSIVNCIDNVGIIIVLNLYWMYVNDGVIVDILYLFCFRSGINIF